MTYTSPFRAEHLLGMELQKRQNWIEKYLNLESTRTLESEWAVTLFEDEKPIACAGVMVYWPGRAMVWCFIGTGVRRADFLKHNTTAKKFLKELPFRRLEAAVDIDFKEGHRWAKVLGFKMEAECMKAFQIDGRDCALYSRIQA